MRTWKEWIEDPLYKQDVPLDEEQWEDVPEYPDTYQVSSLGRVRSKDRVRLQKHPSGKMIEHLYRGQLIAPDYSTNELGALNIYDRKVRKSFQIYCLVCRCFGQEHADCFFYGYHTPLYLEGETWRDIPGYEGLYKVSDLGRVKKINKDYQIVMKSWEAGEYQVVRLSKNNIQEDIGIHRLVAMAFIPNPENKAQVNHIDGDKFNNTLTNLEWVTPSENMKHAYRTGLLVVSSEVRRKAALAAAKATSVPVYCKQLDKLFTSLSEASRCLNIDVGRIQHASVSGTSVEGYTFERRK